MKNGLLNFASPLIAFLLWEILSQTGIIDIRFFPPPSDVLVHLFTVSPEEGILTDIGASLYRIFFGYTLGVSVGIALGIAIGLSNRVRIVFYPIIALLYPIPKIAILPLIMLIFGIGDLSKIVVVFIGSFFLVLINTVHGVASISKIHHQVGQVYRIPRWNFVLRIILPGSLPAIFTGLKLAIGYSLVIVVAAEFSGANAGIGYLIWQSWETFSILSMYAGIFVIAALGFIFTFGLEYLEKRLLPWVQR